MTRGPENTSERRDVSVHLLPGLIPVDALAGGVAVVVDVLRATTVMVQALASGSEAVIPCLEVDEARLLAAGLARGTALLGGERLGLPIEGFDLGNSPGSYTPEVCTGKTLVMTTTNGTRAIHASLRADRVLIASFLNARATVDALRAEREPRPIHVVASGTDGLVSFEDTLLAGCLARGWADQGRLPANDSAEIAMRTWLWERSTGGPADLAASIGAGRGGRRVRQIGLAADVRETARLDRFGFVAELTRDPLRITRAD